MKENEFEIKGNFKRILGQDEETMKEYVKTIKKNKDPVFEMAKIIKQEKRTIINYIQTGLLIILVILTSYEHTIVTGKQGLCFF